MKPAAPVTTAFTADKVGPPGRWIASASYPVSLMSRFEAWLANSNTGVTVRGFPEGTRTAKDAARGVGWEVGQIVKSLGFVAGGKPAGALRSGANRLDEKRVAARQGENRARTEP